MQKRHCLARNVVVDHLKYRLQTNKGIKKEKFKNLKFKNKNKKRQCGTSFIVYNQSSAIVAGRTFNGLAKMA